MIRPATCLSLVAAVGAGLYLYQEKHRAQLLDREITRTVKQAEQGRDRIGLLRAEWALLTEPARLADLASHHLQLQPTQLSQFAKLEDLPGRLPPPATAALVAAMDDAPDAPAVVAALPVSAPVKTVPPAVQASPAPKPAAVQLVVARPAPKPAAPRVLASFRPPEHEPATPLVRTSYASAMPAYAPAYAPVAHAPTLPMASVQATSVQATGAQTASLPAVSMPPAAFVGSSLGMARTMLPAPVPTAAPQGYAAGR